MRIINSLTVNKFMLVAILGAGSLALSACSSPEEDATVREEPAMPIDAQQPVEQEIINSPSTTVNDEGAIPTAESAFTNIAPEESNSGIATTEEDIATTEIGTHDNPDILDGTDQEEHVSTY